MNEGLLRAWARDHTILIDGIIAVVVVVACALRGWIWLRRTDLPTAVAELGESVATRPAAPPPGAPMTRRTARIAATVLLVLAVVVASATVRFSLDEYGWLGAEVAPARVMTVSIAGGTVTGRYQVQPLTRGPFVATISLTPRGDRWPEAAEAMRADRV